ncbi:hypothetical protein A3Q56_03375 [Intoshia linei]|uniref:Uncharacterized protein n=1 Tax=Intoshia linei TaxID=1819745 RepID=A0A177B3J4_9BILA|nr:hypothetical protein A3Q56_03375 [Intoshia linei]
MKINDLPIYDIEKVKENESLTYKLPFLDGKIGFLLENVDRAKNSTWSVFTSWKSDVEKNSYISRITEITDTYSAKGDALTAVSGAGVTLFAYLATKLVSSSKLLRLTLPLSCGTLFFTMNYPKYTNTKYNQFKDFVTFK